MYNMLIEYLKRPALYERTTKQFCNDPYIATQMLKAHLDSNTDAASRKPDFIHRCAKWVASFLPKCANLLDIGCGPDLYTKQFNDVTGKPYTHDCESLCAILKKGESL